MKKPKRATREDISYGEAWRRFLSELLRARIKTKNDRESLARAMNVSIHQVATMLYRAEGGFDAWASALSIAYGLKVKDVNGLFVLLKQAFKQTAPLSKSDEVWTKLDELVDENEKYYWVTMLQGLITADREFHAKQGKK
jgi:hypothetical protein